VTTAIGTGTAEDTATAVQLVGDKILVGGHSLLSNGSHVVGLEHEAAGVMRATLDTGTRETPEPVAESAGPASPANGDLGAAPLAPPEATAAASTAVAADLVAGSGARRAFHRHPGAGHHRRRGGGARRRDELATRSAP
jgi:hypothetical protein